jgi:hypothetical protein
MKNRIITLEVKYKWKGFFLPFLFGVLVIWSAASTIAAFKSEQLRKQQSEELESLQKKYDWKTNRLKVYTDIIYKKK